MGETDLELLVQRQQLLCHRLWTVSLRYCLDYFLCEMKIENLHIWVQSSRVLDRKMEHGMDRQIGGACAVVWSLHQPIVVKELGRNEKVDPRSNTRRWP